MTRVYRLGWQTRPVDFAANMLSLSTWTYASQVLPQIARQTSTLNDERIWKLTWRQGCPFQWVDGPTVLAKQWNAGKVMYVIWDISCNLFWSDTSLVLRLQRVSSMRARIRLGSHAVGPCWTVARTPEGDVYQQEALWGGAEKLSQELMHRLRSSVTSGKGVC